MKNLTTLSLLALLAHSAPAFAYIGPGLGVGTLLAILGVIGSIFLAIFAVLWYPLKRMLAKRKAAASSADKTAADD